MSRKEEPTMRVLRASELANTATARVHGGTATSSKSPLPQERAQADSKQAYRRTPGTAEQSPSPPPSGP